MGHMDATTVASGAPQLGNELEQCILEAKKTDKYRPEPKTGTLTVLPAEILDSIIAYLSPEDLFHTSIVCKRLAKLIDREQIWQDLVQRRVPTRLQSPSPFSSWKELYGVHHPNWFLAQHKLWFSDDWPYGKLLVARYDPRSGCIEAYAVTATHTNFETAGILDWGVGEATYQDFRPKVQLDLNTPVVRLADDDFHRNEAWDGGPPRRGSRMKSEVSMRTIDRLSTTFIFTKDLPADLVNTQTALWPALTLASPNGARTRISTSSSYRSVGHRPYRLSEASSATFRVRTCMPVHPLIPTFMHGATMNFPNERIDTFGTLDPASYSPTPEKPWQGIWVGDYSAHGCEFLVLTQPDDPEWPLPEKARSALAKWPQCAPWEEFWPEMDPRTFEDIPGTSQDEEGTPPVCPAPQGRHKDRDRPPYRGRLIATKLTGDPNVPRAEYTFIVPSLGEDGFVEHTKDRGFVPPNVKDALEAAEQGQSEALEELLKSGWRGSRAYKSILHIADAGSRRDSYIPSQTVLVSENVIALWWMIAPHVSFYRRVDLDALLKVE